MDASQQTGAAAKAVRVIRPDSRVSDGWFRALAHLIGELWRYRSHIATIFGRDFRQSYRGTVLGVVWNILLPLVPISVYALLMSLRVVPAFDGVNSAVAVSFGATIWFLLAGCVNQPIQVVRGRNTEAMKTSLPLSVAIASSFARLSFDTLVRLVAVAIIIVATGTSLAGTAPFALLVLVPTLLFCLGLGLFLALINIVVPDIERVTSIVLQYGLFVSGVIFPLAAAGPLAILEDINPFAVFIGAARDLTFHSTLTHVWPFAAFGLVGLLVFLVAARLFYVMEYRIRGVV